MLAVLAGVMPDLPTVQIGERVETPYGPAYGPPTSVTAYVEARRRRVLDLDGVEALSETTVYAPTGTECGQGARLTLPGGQATTVIAVRVHHGAGAPTPDHVEIVCQ
ncbi:hypothetical protein STSO111631_20110 [Stackebrandtia soli]